MLKHYIIQVRRLFMKILLYLGISLSSKDLNWQIPEHLKYQAVLIHSSYDSLRKSFT